jgi:hypothetical protein
MRANLIPMELVHTSAGSEVDTAVGAGAGPPLTNCACMITKAATSMPMSSVPANATSNVGLVFKVGTSRDSLGSFHYPTAFHHEYHEWTNDTNFIEIY